MQKVGLIGWRGMVGSVLMERMQQENDFALIDAVFFSTSQAGQKAPSFNGKDYGVLQDAYDLDALKQWTSSLLHRVAITQLRCIKPYVSQVGMVTGSMQPQHCVWKMILRSS